MCITMRGPIGAMRSIRTVPKLALFALLGLASIVWSAQVDNEPDLDAAGKALTERLVLDRAASLAGAQRKANERERELLTQLAAKDKTLRAQQRKTTVALKDLEKASAQQRDLTRQVAAHKAEFDQTQQQLDALTAERLQLVREIENRDAEFKAELAEYRLAVAGLAASPSPERRAALERYADGDRLGAFPILEELTRAETEARRKAAEKMANLQSAKDYRELAALAADMQDRGEKTTADVLQIWDQAAKLDADDLWTWVYIARLSAEAGATNRAMSAARNGVRVARTEHEKKVAQTELGRVQVAAGDLAGARKSFEDSLKLARQLAAVNPSSADEQRDVSVSLIKLGEVQVAAGDLPGARKSFEDSYQLRQRLAAANPSSAAAQRDVWASLWLLATLPSPSVRWEEVAKAIRAIQSRGILGPIDRRFLEEAERRAAEQER